MYGTIRQFEEHDIDDMIDSASLLDVAEEERMEEAIRSMPTTMAVRRSMMYVEIWPMLALRKSARCKECSMLYIFSLVLIVAVVLTTVQMISVVVEERNPSSKITLNLR